MNRKKQLAADVRDHDVPTKSVWSPCVGCMNCALTLMVQLLHLKKLDPSEKKTLLKLFDS